MAINLVRLLEQKLFKFSKASPFDEIQVKENYRSLTLNFLNFPTSIRL